MVALLIGLIALVGIGIYVIFQQQRRHQEEIRKQLEQIQERDIIIADLKERAIRAESETESLKKLLEENKKFSDEKQKDLREQLELLGKDFVTQGSRILKSENELQLGTLLKPLKERLEAFEKEVRENNKQDIERFSSMEGLVKALSEQHHKMHSTAQNLVDALKGEQKVQGDWGELALERILESSGLEKGREYFIQNSYRNESGELQRPDVIVQLPEDKHLIIDSKVSLKAFEQYINEEDPEKKKQALNNHIVSIKTHIKQLSDKDYSSLSDLTSPDFVLMFIPLESSFALAVKEEPTIYQQAWSKKVILVTPSTLLATLKTVENIWKQERQTRNAFEIAEQAGRLYDKFVGFVSDLEKVGNKQQEALKSYNEAISKLHTGKGNLVRSAEKLRELGVKTKKKLDDKFLGEDDQPTS
ncbi:MAG: DNA recombination protein RmuC [Bacteroidetes bacterium]|nr:MAG: DNA recombination protein RmuC [Bacteroidota bacterium]